jgi:hypothetical protein
MSQHSISDQQVIQIFDQNIPAQNLIFHTPPQERVPYGGFRAPSPSWSSSHYLQGTSDEELEEDYISNDELVDYNSPLTQSPIQSPPYQPTVFDTDNDNDNDDDDDNEYRGGDYPLSEEDEHIARQLWQAESPQAEETDDEMPPLEDVDFTENIVVDEEMARQAFLEAGSFQGAVYTLVEILGDMLEIPDNLTQQLIEPVSEAMEDVFHEINPDFFKPIDIRLDKQQFNQLITRKVMGKKLRKLLPTDDYCCVICQEEITSHQHCSILGCKHFFHLNCARQWFSKQCSKPTCPCCRKDAREMETFDTVLQLENAQKNTTKLRRSARIFQNALKK